jgi:hypothetical protein
MKMIKTKLLTTWIIVVMAAALLSLIPIQNAKAVTTYFSENWAAGNFNQWTWHTGDSATNTIFNAGGGYGNVANLSGVAWNDYQWATSDSEIAYGAVDYLHFSSDVRIVAMPLGGANWTYGEMGMSPDEWSSPSAAFVMNDFDEFATYYNSSSNTQLFLDSFSYNTWYHIDIYVVLGEKIDWYIDSVWKRTVLSTGMPKEQFDRAFVGMEINQYGTLENPVSGGYQIHLDNIIIDDEALVAPVSFFGSPEHNYGFTIDAGTSHSTPYDEILGKGSHTFLASQTTKMLNSSTVYGFKRWKIENTSGTFYYNSSSAIVNIQEATNATLEYTALNIYVSSSPDCHPTFTSELGYTHTAAVNLTYPTGSHTFTAAKTISANSTYRYTFLYWKLNGTTNYPQVSISLTYAGYTTLQLFYSGAYIPPDIPMIRNYGAYNATWYMRSDTHTVHEQLGYRLLTENTHTPSFDTRTHSGTANTSYGVRVWAIDFRGSKHELSSGSPVAIVERTTVGASILQGYWVCPAWGSMIDAIEVDLYQRFNSEAWVLIRIFVSSDDLLIRLPSSTWTFFYHVNKTTGSTNSTFGWGSYTTYSSKVNLQYYKASPWDMALARLMERQFVGFLFTPWTYWFGDLFWTILLFGMITTAYMRFGSFKPILALLWILGGSGSILWALVPAVALHVAAIMLALAMAISLFRLIYK